MGKLVHNYVCIVFEGETLSRVVEFRETPSSMEFVHRCAIETNKTGTRVGPKKIGSLFDSVDVRGPRNEDVGGLVFKHKEMSLSLH